MFTETLQNEGGGYQNDGVFTVPLEGRYMFSAHVCTFPNRAIVYRIVADDVVLIISTQGSPTYECSTADVFAYLQVGQKVRVECIFEHKVSGSVISDDGHRTTMFSGLLV